jgi:hypothetical protein
MEGGDTDEKAVEVVERQGRSYGYGVCSYVGVDHRRFDFGDHNLGAKRQHHFLHNS